MPSLALSVILLASLVVSTSGRATNTPDSIMPFIFPSVKVDSTAALVSPNGQYRLIHVIEQIIRYVSSIKSPEEFIQGIVNRQREPADRIKVLTFLNKCFELTRNIIETEIKLLQGGTMGTTRKRSSYSSPPFTLEELRQAQRKVNDLLMTIEKQMELLKTWIPPTMPFLGFF